MTRRPAKVTAEDIRQAMAALAVMIDEEPFGDELWPLFDRLERELALTAGRQDRLAAARAFASAPA